MRNRRTVPHLAFLLTILALACGSALVLGQGGTGKEPTAPPKKTTTAKKASARKTTPSTKMTMPTNTSQVNSSSSNMPHTRTNQVGIEFVLISPGRFMMGSTNGADDEKPVHEVTISQAFYMGKYEVTQAQWQAVMGSNPSYSKDCGTNCPVEQVSWNDAENFINKLNEANDGLTYRLPSESEWEYACRAGTTGD